MKATLVQKVRSMLGLAAALLIAFAALQPMMARAQDAQGEQGKVFLPQISTGDQAVDQTGDQTVDAAEAETGAVYVLTNQTGGNAVQIYRRSADGALAAAAAIPTGGTGTGAGLGSQGALALSDNGRWLFAVNAGSNDVSVFRVHDGELELTDRVPSGGVRPISVTVDKDVVYVLNAGGSGNISGFRIGKNGRLTSLANSTRFLSNNDAGAAPGPAQVTFSPKGDLLVVTEKASNQVITYTVDKDGIAGAPVVHPSSGATPFGFAFTRQGTLVVSEAFGGAANASAVSSYAASSNEFRLISGSVPTGQTAACWIAVTKNGKFAYSTNAGSASVSAYAVGRDGSLALIDGRAGVTGAGPTDVATAHNGQYLYVLASRVPEVSIFAIQSDGRLVALGSAAGLPAGAVGIAAW